jgi:hypothetical protein
VRSQRSSISHCAPPYISPASATLRSMAPILEKTSSPDPSSRAHIEAALLKDGAQRIRLGVWQAWLPAKKRWLFKGLGPTSKEEVKTFLASTTYVRRFLADIYQLGPQLVIATWILEVWESTLNGWTLFYTNQLLSTVRDEPFLAEFVPHLSLSRSKSASHRGRSTPTPSDSS